MHSCKYYVTSNRYIILMNIRIYNKTKYKLFINRRTYSKTETKKPNKELYHYKNKFYFFW